MSKHPDHLAPPLDYPLLFTVLFLLGFGFIMVSSASMPIGARPPLNNPFHYMWRHLFALTLAFGAAWVCYLIPLNRWAEYGTWLFLFGISLLILVLIPGVGTTVNGATRWIRLGVLNVQTSELMKLFAVIYVSSYLVRRQVDVITTVTGFIRPMLFIGVAAALIVIQPDFGTAAVLIATVLGLLFLGGVPLIHFVILFGLVLSALVVLVLVEPYRLVRVTSFMQPFADPFNTGYQLSQALIAFGRGEWLGVGLGNGIQKQYFLPEAHTDFLLAVIGEECGLLGIAAVIGGFGFIVWRAWAIAVRAKAANELFAAYTAHGIGLWLGLQAFVNAGVNTGLLPTKGITLPFMSYGSNAVIVATMAAAVLLRIDSELRRKTPLSTTTAGGRRWAHA